MEYLVEKELKAIVGKGAFGKNRNFVSFKSYNCTTGMEEWCYQRICCVVTTSDGSLFNITIKLKLEDFVLRQCFQCDLLFDNEIFFYENIIPFLLECRGPIINDAHALYLPRFFYGRNKCSEMTTNDLIVIENVSCLGYRISNDKVFLDYDHLTITLQTIAKFHGLSYTAKHKDPLRFRDMVAGIKGTHFDAGGHWMAQSGMLKKCGRRAVNRLLERDDGHRYRDHAHVRRLTELFDDADGTLMRTMEGREPLSVICHCDFSRNTLLFQYDERGRPFDALAVDFFMLHYGSPALDLSSFLYTSTTRPVRESHWDDLLDTYCAALAASVAPGVRVPGRAEIDAEMAAVAVNGFAKASFSLMFLLRARSEELDSLATSDDPVDYFLALGGETATECLADVVQHLVDMGYTDVARDSHSDPIKNAD